MLVYHIISYNFGRTETDRIDQYQDEDAKLHGSQNYRDKLLLIVVFLVEKKRLSYSTYA